MNQIKKMIIKQTHFHLQGVERRKKMEIQLNVLNVHSQVIMLKNQKLGKFSSVEKFHREKCVLK